VKREQRQDVSLCGNKEERIGTHEISVQTTQLIRKELKVDNDAAN